MEYRTIGVMSGSSLDGLDICFVVFQESGGKWQFSIEAAECLPFSDEWQIRLKTAVELPAKDYLLLHTQFGHYIGNQILNFIEKHKLFHRVQLICSHGHTTFHLPQQKMTSQLGDGAAIAAVTGIPVVCDLRAVDVALSGQGAPIVPVGEKLLFEEFGLFLNIGGIANISALTKDGYIAYDICPANRVLNMLAMEKGMAFDKDGALAAKGTLRDEPLYALNQLPYYALSYPKSLANEFGIFEVYPLLKKFNLNTQDALRTMVEHVAIQISRNTGRLIQKMDGTVSQKMLITGGGALNLYMIERLKSMLQPMGIEVVLPEPEVINYKEALIMALLGILRWRDEVTVFNSVTGAIKSSVGGCVWAS